MQESHLTHPGLTQVTSQQARENEDSLASSPTAASGEQANPPLSTDPVTPSADMPSDPSPQALTWEKPETQPVTFEWNPSPSGDAMGYKILVTTMSAKIQYAFETGPETHLTVNLPKGESYYATLFAFNSAGQSPRTEYLRFDLF